MSTYAKELRKCNEQIESYFKRINDDMLKQLKAANREHREEQRTMKRNGK